MMSERAHLEAVSRHFDRLAVDHTSGQEPAEVNTSARAAFEALALSDGHRFLDIGCGDGQAVRWAAELSKTIQAIGIDVSAEMINRARRRCTDLPNARLIHAPFPLPILKAKAFDGIISIDTFQYFRALQWALVSAIRLLKPGGLFACVIDQYKDQAIGCRQPDEIDFELSLLSASEWADEMVAVGFEIVYIKAARSAHGTVNDSGGDDRLLIIARRPVDS